MVFTYSCYYISFALSANFKLLSVSLIYSLLGLIVVITDKKQFPPTLSLKNLVNLLSLKLINVKPSF